MDQLGDLKDYINAGAVGVLVLVLGILYRAGRCLATRLFHEQSGLVTQWVRAQQSFVESVQTQNAITHLAIERNTDGVIALCSVLRRVCREKVGVDVDEEIDRVESLVRAAGTQK